LIARSGQPFQCRIFSLQYADYNLERRDRIQLDEGHTCPYFLRVTSKQIEDILRSHGSSLTAEQVREYAHTVEEEVILKKTVTFVPRAGTSAEEILREELLRYLLEGYSIVEATITREETDPEDEKPTTRRITLRVKHE
jgi:hypothetical protein